MLSKRGASQSQERHFAYVVLSGLFFAIFAAVMGRGRDKKGSLDLKPFDLVQLSLATYRMGRLVAYDKVTETYRLPFTKTESDAYGASDTVVPRGEGIRRAMGELISCPICAGTWIASALVYGLHLAPGPTRALLAIMSSIGAAELLNAATEALQWTGEAARKRVGSH
jgi:hypothetical protein